MPGILCEHCTALCCRYIALPIDPPESKQDFDDIRWYLLHEGVTVFVEDHEWYLGIATNCRHLQPDFRCGIYATRPRICRTYSTENCDYHSGDYNWQHHFASPEHLDEYVAANPPKAPRRKRKAGGRPGRPRLKARLSRRRVRATDYARAKTDIRGVPLPVIEATR